MSTAIFAKPTALWKEDVLGKDFQQTTLELGHDDEGDVVATLVRYLPKPAKKRWFRPAPPALNADVLYIHGWSDYFFQRHLAEYWRAQGARFYALDLRKYGRSLRPGQTPGFISDLKDYDVEIEKALEVMGQDESRRGRRPLILMGHSTGGLTLSLWVDRHPGRALALILNSPWLEYQLHSATREIVTPVVKVQKLVKPKAALPNIDLGFYHKTVARSAGGEWEYNEQWRPARAFDARNAWMATILEGHRRIAAGLDITIPVLTLLSTKSIFAARWSENMREADTVIDVNLVARRAVGLGTDVTVIRIPEAIHDVFLSKPDARAHAFAETTHWITGYLGNP